MNLELLFESNIINFIIAIILIAVIIITILKKSSFKNFSEVLQKMSDEIKNYVNSSVDEKNAADKELNEINDKIAHLKNDTEEINKSAQNNIIGLEKNIKKQIEEKKIDIQNNSDRILKLEEKNFKQKLTGILSQASVNLAKENAVKQLNKNRDLHDKYIEEAINNLDRIDL